VEEIPLRKRGRIPYGKTLADREEETGVKRCKGKKGTKS